MQRRISELDGVRGIAILLVLLWHAGLRLQPLPGTLLAYLMRMNELSWSGVDLFFVLSGFLIGGSLISNRERLNYFSTFYLRRACRILPLYFVMLSAIFALDAAGIPQTGVHTIPIGYYLTFTQNFWMLANGWWLSLGQTWSLAVEEQFYFTLPALVWFMPRRWLLPALLALALTAPVIRTVIVYASNDPLVAVHVMLPCRMDSLLLGVLAALSIRSDGVRQWLARNGVALYAVFLALLACTLFMLAERYVLGSDVMMTVGYSVLAALYVTFLLLSLRDGPIQKLCRLAWLRHMGIWAYGLYLLHWSVTDLILRASGAHEVILDGYDLSVFVISTVMVFVVAAASWHYFESPLVEWSHRAKYDITSKIPTPLSVPAPE